ncbi:uncharacterized protein A1O9_09076 [Exophiala aquamarina CBS 119918]|uniref:Uncharacterized protein n=1 Tax=Exophiala aquamarina CBS 119918 TaxID=1182545 RepID=A0A072P3C9_9EURO|nr:uncharacterized protein A1O9_09076 [Exophiala aquamarina CBS 119918]KEF54634.1 hypothetical protein A1O9_09076 [Exophiala aquamarina CBS 119918]
MVLFKLILSLGLILAMTVDAIPTPGNNPHSNELPGCGEVNVILTGLPPYHPLVIAQGHDPNGTDASLRESAAMAIEAGYNVRFSFMGPEKPLSLLEDRMEGIDWAGTGVGMGIRGSGIPELVVRLEDIIQTYRDVTPDAFIYFNYMPNTTLWAIQRRFPLSSNCTDSPGKDLVGLDPDFLVMTS